MDFASFGFHGIISANIKAMGYTAPTPIQAQAMPHVLEGRDIMGLAQTGTGKTAAFLLPLIQRFMDSPVKARGVRILIIAPTRELAEQIHQSATALGRKTGLKCATIYGGVGLAPQVRALRQGANCVVACPGRLLDHIRQGNVELGNLEALVLDEADHMFDMGFLPDLKRILAALPAKRQNLLFSATMPGSIRSLAEEVLRDPVRVAIGHSAPVETVSHAVYPVAQHLKTKLLLELLRQKCSGSALIFTRTKHKARQLAEQLQRAGHKAASLQGNLSQNKRQSTLDAFRRGSCTVLVATDIAARGIDVSAVGQVINYDMPDTPETYTHRIGRTGRAERKGEACSLTTREDQRMLLSVERLLGKPIERRTIDGFDYQVAPTREETLAIREETERLNYRGRRNDRRSGSGQNAGSRSQAPARSGSRSGNGASSGNGNDSRPASRFADSGKPKPQGRRDARPEAGSYSPKAKSGGRRAPAREAGGRA